MKQYLILFSGLAVGLLLAVQLNSKLLPERDTNITSEEDFKAVYSFLQNEQNELKEELKELRTEESQKLKILSVGVQSRLDEAQKKAGFTQVNGEGVIIRFSPQNPEKYNTQNYASYLQNILNLLFNIRSEAISLNGYRVVFKTPITPVGENILLNNFHITAPFEIQVIGNPDFILSALEVKESIAGLREEIRNGNISMEVQKVVSLEIPALIH